MELRKKLRVLISCTLLGAFSLVGCSKEVGGLQPEVPTKKASLAKVEAMIELRDGENSAISYRVPIGGLRSTYETEKGGITGLGEYWPNDRVEVSFGEKEGYTYVGWYAQYAPGTYLFKDYPNKKEYLKKTPNLTLTIAGDITIIGVFEKKPSSPPWVRMSGTNIYLPDKGGVHREPFEVMQGEKKIPYRVVGIDGDEYTDPAAIVVREGDGELIIEVLVNNGERPRMGWILIEAAGERLQVPFVQEYIPPVVYGVKPIPDDMVID